jgi:transcription elongation factor Elf1
MIPKRLPTMPGRTPGQAPRWRVQCPVCLQKRTICGFPKRTLERNMRCHTCAGALRITTGVTRTAPGNRKRRLRCPRCKRTRTVMCTLAWARERHQCRVCGQRSRREAEARAAREQSFCGALDAVF